MTTRPHIYRVVRRSKDWKLQVLDFRVRHFLVVVRNELTSQKARDCSPSSTRVPNLRRLISRAAVVSP